MTKFAIKAVIEALAEIAVYVYSLVAIAMKGIRNCIRSAVQYI